jgi:hypothetical protein
MIVEIFLAAGAMFGIDWWIVGVFERFTSHRGFPLNANVTAILVNLFLAKIFMRYPARLDIERPPNTKLRRRWLYVGAVAVYGLVYLFRP